MNNGEYFLIETEEELKQAYEMFKDEWLDDFSLKNEINYFLRDEKYRLIGKTEKNAVCLRLIDDCLLFKEIPSPLKKNTITNPIKDNRIVSDKTFALRFCGFLDNVSVADACSNDELSYLKSVARKLLTYQSQTAKEENEINYISYLKDRFEKYMEKGLTTEDGYTFYRGDDVKLFSCMRQPQKSDDNTIMFRVDSIFGGGVNPNRVFFREQANRDKYIEDNLVQYSKKDLEQLIKNK